jgi:anaerobic magnesium-protoporphyrin IX monomethyl ester cyclase
MMRGASGSDVLLVEDLSQQRLPARTLAAVLRQAGFSAQLANFGPGDDPRAVVALAQAEQPRLIVLSILFAHLVAENLALITRLRAAGVSAHMTMVGPLPTFASTELLAACLALDSVLRGEAEASVVQLATGLEDTTALQAIPGLAYRSPAVRANPLSQAVPNLDNLPFPARDDGIPTHVGFGFATVEGSRGCYHACTFCLPCVFYRAGTAPPYRLRSVSNLVDEIETLYRRGARLFLFDDEQFLPPGRERERRVRALGEQLKRRGLDIAFTIKCRADDVDKALFRQLKAMGLIRVYLGVESGCQASLDLLGKHVTAACNAQALALLDMLDIVADFRSLIFHPWSTLETIRADLEFLGRMLPYAPTPFDLREVECYPGTPLAERLQAEGRGKGEPWPLSYAIADPGAELLRRLARVVFGSRNADGGLHSQITRAWYDVLLLRRFRPERFAASKARALRDTVSRLNRESLAIWREMVSLAADGDLHDADRINECASAWAGCVRALDLMVKEGCSDIQKPSHLIAVHRQL